MGYRKMSKNLIVLCSTVLWRVQLASNEDGYLTEQISKQSIEGKTWVRLTTYNKIGEKKDKLKNALLNKTKQNKTK